LSNIKKVEYKNLSSALENISSSSLEKNINFRNFEINKFVIDNLIFTVEILKKNIIKKYNDDLESLNTKLKKVESNKSLEEYKLNSNTNIREISTVNMSNKAKKAFKKLRSTIEQDPKINLNLQKNIGQLSKEYSNLKIEISKKENYIKNLEISLKDKSLNELNEIYYKSNISSKSKISGFKLKKIKNANLITNNVGYQRSFTTLRINNNKFNNKLEVSECLRHGGFTDNANDKNYPTENNKNISFFKFKSGRSYSTYLSLPTNGRHEWKCIPLTYAMPAYAREMKQSLNINKTRGFSYISGIKHIITEITTNPLYVKISQILNSSVYPQPLNNREKQLQIEETLRFFWNQELCKLFKGKKSLFNNSIGINILMNSISKLDKVLNTIKTDKRYLKNKSYRNHIMLSENGIIVSIVLSNIIPHMMKYKSSQNTATLFKRIGTDLHSNLLNNEWYKYANTNTKKKKDTDHTQKNYSLEQNNNNYEFEKGLSKEEFYIRLDEILGIISSDDYFKLGCDLADIISENSNMFKFMNVANEDNTVQRVIVPGKELDDQIVKLLAVDTEKLVMICKPCK